MTAEPESLRILRTLNERDQTFRKLSSSLSVHGITATSRELQARLADMTSPGVKLAEQLRNSPHQRAIDIARQLSELTGSSSAHPAAALRGTTPHEKPGNRVSTVAELGALVRHARKRMKLNQSQFAAHAGVGRRFISELESGKATLEFDKVMACARAAGIDLTAKLRHA